MNLTKLDKLVRLQTQLINNLNAHRSDSSYEMVSAINEVSKAVRAELTKKDDEEVMPF